MPVREVTIDGERGYRWGDAGAFYPFDPSDNASRERARAKAELQGEVIQRRRAAASGLSFVPPQAVRAAARRALDLRASLPPSRRAMTAVGIARARDLGNGRALTLETVQRMASYFARHEVDRQGEGWGVDSKGWQAWLGWGGDAGRAWAESILRKHLP